VPRYLVRRLVQALVSIFGVVTATFFLVRLSGDPAALLLGPEATAADIAQLSSTLGFDEPAVVQYARFLGGAFTGDLGSSLVQRQPALAVVLDRLPYTLELALSSFALGIALAFVVVLTMQLTGSRRLRSVVLWVSSARQAIPSFWFGLLLVLFFAVQLGWLPALGRTSPISLVLPAVTIASLELALYIRLLDGGFGEQRTADYVRTARSKGQRRHVIVLRHVLPNAVIPLITVAGLNLGALLGGTIVVEMVFNWPGVGQLVLNSISRRDYPVVQAGLLVIALFFVTVNFLVDMLYAAVDPRVRFR
jgi:peptide/nickel transport system permease protein